MIETLTRGSEAVSRLPHKQEIVGSIPTPAKKYQRIGQLIIRPLVLRKEKSAFDIARIYYAHYSDLDFEDDLVDYMRSGFVVSRPHLFAMVKAIEHEGERIWFIRCIVGDLLEAISCMPCYLPKVAFCRNNQPGKMVVVDTERAISVSKMFAKKSEGTNGR